MEGEPVLEKHAAASLAGMATFGSSFKTYLKEQGHVVHRHAEVCVLQGVLVRSGVELDSDKVGRLPHRATVSVIREARTATGVLRLRITTRGGSFVPSPVDGWVSDVSAKGTKLLETTDAHPPEDGERGGAGEMTGVVAFSEFVLDEVMSACGLCAGSGVLDVAGGTGPLSMELAKRGVGCGVHPWSE